MKKIILMLVCIAGLACYSVGGNEPTAAAAANQTVQAASAVAAEPQILLWQNGNQWYLTVTGNDRPLYVLIDGPETPGMDWRIPAGGATVLIYTGNQFVSIVEWWWAPY